MQTDTLAIDFGTSNSAAAIWQDGAVRYLPIERGRETLPTAVFFPEDRGRMMIGAAATEALIEGEEGRYMRALKSVLGLPLVHETRLICGKRRSIIDVITAFLIQIKTRAEAETGQVFTRALSGRPVHFHTKDPAKDDAAEADLRACYMAAGFAHVDFLVEPEAAALASSDLGASDKMGLIVDIGGGTSDFSVFETTAGRPRILANYGIRLGGTDFDHAISMQKVMPALGLGTQLRREMGAGLLPVPRAPYVDLSTWAKIPFLYNADTRRLAKDMARHAVDEVAMKRFVTVLEMELGHELAFAVERGKIGANGEDAASFIDMGAVTRGLKRSLDAEDLDAALSGYGTALTEAACETLQMAQISPEEIGRIILVGGSSLMGFVRAQMEALCTRADTIEGKAFTAVVDGLAIATRDA